MSSQLPTVTSPPWSLTTKRLVAFGFITLLVLSARQVSGATWSTILVAIVMAYLLSPVVTFFERRLSIIPGYELRRTLSVVLTWLSVVGILALLIWLVVPATLAQSREFADDLPGLISDAERELKDLLSEPIRVGDTTIVLWDELEGAFAQDGGQDTTTSLSDFLQGRVFSLADPALSAVGGAVSALFTLFFVLVMLFYLMRDGPVFAQYLVESVPESYRGDMLRLLHELGQVWNAYLRGQIVLCLAVGAATYVAALILGLPQPLVLGLVAGFLEFIPNLGPTLAQIPALLFALTTPSSTISSLDAGLLYAVVVSLTYIGIQNLEAVFLVPRILGRSLDLHPFVVLVAILMGASVAGVLGVVLAAPSVATLRLVGRYLRGKLLDEEVFPATPYPPRASRQVGYRLMRFFLSKRIQVLENVYDDRFPEPSDLLGESKDGADYSGWAR